MATVSNKIQKYHITAISCLDFNSPHNPSHQTSIRKQSKEAELNFGQKHHCQRCHKKIQNGYKHCLSQPNYMTI